MRYDTDDEEWIDIDEAMVREAVREVVQGMLMQVTGQLDPAGRRYAVTPLGRVPLDARGTTPARREDVLELADETPAERHRRQEREAAIIFRTVDNSMAANLTTR